MGLSRKEALETLQLPMGADLDTIRTSYKRMASNWHPEIHKTSPESIKKFLEISMAYRRLLIESDIVQMSMDDCLKQYQRIFCPVTNGYDSVSDDDDDDEDDYYDEEDDEDDDISHPSIFKKFSMAHLQQSMKGLSLTRKLTEEESEQNASDLISEEERERRRAEKRRAKKKRRREKKREEKIQEQKKKEEEQKKKATKQTNPTPAEENTTKSKSKQKSTKAKDSSGSGDDDGFDCTAAFFTQVANKKKRAGGGGDAPAGPGGAGPGGSGPGGAGGPVRKGDAKTQNGTDDANLDPVVLRSRQLAMRGNEMANSGHYQAAIDLFTEAIKLDSTDFRFFGNRSYCFDRMQLYEKALKDAEKAIILEPKWPKGYFRKGRALAGLKLCPDAEQAFSQVLNMDKNCEDAMQELVRVRTYQLTEMGFSRQQAEQALKQNETVQQALDSLLAGGENSLAGEVYVSDEEDYGTLMGTQPLVTPAVTSPVVGGPSVTESAVTPSLVASDLPRPGKSNDRKMDPANPEGLTALWVGNVLPTVTEKMLLQMFSKQGQVTSVRLLPEKYCAFINYKTKEAAGKAMQILQGAECDGQRLRIKFPDNPICNTNNNVVLRKSSNPPTTTKPSSNPSNHVTGQLSPRAVAAGKKASGQVAPLAAAAAAAGSKASGPVSPPAAASGNKLSGPVNGDECYFWRTTGCRFEQGCKHKHVPEHRGVDKKPWQKTK